MMAVDPASILTIEALRKPRSYGEFVAWMDKVQAEFEATPETREYLRLQSGPSKIYREEVWPFRILADDVFADTDATIVFPADEGKCDVIVKCHDGPDNVQCIQIVNAVDGHDDRLRMELLSRTGSSPARGLIEKVGPKKAGYEINAEREAQFKSEIVDRLCVQTVTAIEHKRKQENFYPADTWLIVRVHDEFKLGHEQLVEAVTEAARNSQFGRVYLVGGSGTRFCAQVWAR